MPDNGFGNKANSRSFILRLYRVKPNWRTEWGGKGTVTIKSAISLSDPDEKVLFPIVNENTPERILTGGDFDVESVRQAPDGTFYFGEEFGPFIVHVDARAACSTRRCRFHAVFVARQPVPARPHAEPRRLDTASRRWRCRRRHARCTRSSRAR